MKDHHLRKRLASFGLITILLIFTLFSIGATVIIWQATTRAREAVHMSDLDQQAHYFVRAEDEYIQLTDAAGRAKFHATARQLVAVLMKIGQDGDAADRAFVQPLLAEQAHYLLLADQYFTMLDKNEIARAARYKSAVINPVIDHLDKQIYQETTEEHLIASQSLTDLETTERIIIASTALVFATGLFLLILFAKVVRGYQISEAVQAGREVFLEQIALSDPLTGFPNHRALVVAIDQELERSQRYNRCCTLLFLDLDHFKAINDGYGHSIGDAILREFADTLRSILRGMDTLGRWGGEEFIVILPETETEGALKVAERLRAAIAAHVFHSGGGMRLTCSLGIATYPFDSEEREGLVTAADRAMYGAKKLGRNQVRAANDPAILALETDLPGSREDTALAGTVEALTVLVEARDHYTGLHTARVSALTTRLALALGLDASEAYMIGLAGRLHDVGKVAVPDAVLQKPASLTEAEQALMRRHPIVGGDVVSRVPSLRAIAPLIRAHHEQWNGSGYPDGLSGEQIPLGARIVAVVDAYEAMTTDRPYQQAHDEAWALAELRRCAGTQFDPMLVEVLAQVTKADRTQAELATV